MAGITLNGVSKADLELVGKLADKGITSDNVADAIKKAHDIMSTETRINSTQAKEAIYIAHEMLSKDIYTIGKVGELGFGVGAIPFDNIPSGFSPLDGHYNKASENYGNLIDASGSIMVAIPKFYYKIVNNTFLISSSLQDGYVIHRMFINGGVELDYVLVDKYTCGNVGGVFASKFGIDPCSTHADHNPINVLNNTPNLNYGGLYSACKTRGDNHFLTSIFIYNGLAILAKAHSDASTVATCAYKYVAPYLPKGNNNNALKDTNDSSVVYASSGYSNCGLTGAIQNFAKTTHNGQACGVADLNGNMYEVASGFIRYSSLGFLVAKETTDLSSFTSDDTTTGNNQAYDSNLYDVIDIVDLIPETETGTWMKVGNGTEQVFAFSTDRTSNHYKRTSCGLPLGTGVSSGGTTEFGNDGIYRGLRNEMACRVGLSWGYGSYTGVFSMTLGSARNDADSNGGGRASYNVKL